MVSTMVSDCLQTDSVDSETGFLRVSSLTPYWPWFIFYRGSRGEKQVLNRAAIIVRPDKPFVDWARALDDSGILPDPDDEQTVYLVPGFNDEEEAQSILKKSFSLIFEDELFGWSNDESSWPGDRSYAVFRKWFKVEMHSVVEDLCGYELIDED